MIILVIEDDSKIASFVSRGLRRAGYDVETAADGAIGLDKACTAGFDAAVVDLMLPNVDGLTDASKGCGRRA